MRCRMRNLAWCVGIAGVALVLDQVSKAWARTALAAGPQPFIPGVMELVLVGNTGAAFSIGAGSQWVFVLIALAVCAGILVWVWRERTMPCALARALGCVLGGGVGNLVDRLATGTVTDFFATTFIDFPVFNVADIFVTLGVFATLVLYWRWDVAREAKRNG